MTDGHTKRKAGRVCGALVFTFLLVLFLAVKFDFYYDLNDDTMIKDILSGAYTGTPDGHCIQMLYPLSWILALFYKAIPIIPWYGLFLCACQFFVFFVVATRLMELCESLRAGILAVVAQTVLVLGLFLREFVIIQYSVTSGMCMAGAVFLFMTTPHIAKVPLFFRKNSLPLVLVILAFMIRTEVCMMLLPFLLLAGLSKWGSEKKIFTETNFRKYLLLIGTALLGMVAAYSVDIIAYIGADWSSFRSFFDARTKLYDFYELPSYEENRSFYASIGLSEESFALLENYNFALDDSIDTWCLESIVEYQEQLAAEGVGLHDTFGFVSKNSVQEALWLYKNQFRKDFKVVEERILGVGNGLSILEILRLTVAVAYLLYIFWWIFFVRRCKGKKKVFALWNIMLLLAIRSILWMYLYMVDRVLERIVVPLLMLELVMLVGFAIGDMQAGKEDEDRTLKARTTTKVVIGVIYTVCIVCVVLAWKGTMDSVQLEYDKRALADKRWNALMDYCRKNGQNYYVIDVYSSTSFDNAPYSEKIFINVDDSYKNFDICGGWAAKSPLTREKLGKMELKDIQNALCGKQQANKTKAFFIAVCGKDLNWLVEYYKKRGINITTVCIDKIDAEDVENLFEVYELRN